eukprot:scaffold5512_cov202-Prasinococcus_capsulatus_cf.AAC.1
MLPPHATRPPALIRGARGGRRGRGRGLRDDTSAARRARRAACFPPPPRAARAHRAAAVGM